MVASHNTFTYLTPVKWWMKIINFAARCQSKSIDEQYKAGVRFFDIRIKNLRCCVDGWHYDYGHTVSTYKNTPRLEDVLMKYPDCGFRIINEDSKNKDIFYYFCKGLMRSFSKSICNCVEGRDTWNTILRGDYPNMEHITKYSQKANHWWQFGIRCPWIENKGQSQPTQQEYEDSVRLYWYDFV